MDFDLNDIALSFDQGAFARGRDYARRGKVRALACGDDTIDSEVGGSGGQVYRQSIRVERHGRRIEFDGHCSCPVAFDCKHVVAALICALDRWAQPAAAPSAHLPLDLAIWLDRFSVAVQAEPARKRGASQRLLYVLMPEREGVSLTVCKARLGPGGGVITATVVNETYRLLTDPPPFIDSDDLYLLQLFSALSGNRGFSVARTLPSGVGGARLLASLADAACLAWADERAGLKTGIVRSIVNAPARAGTLAWRYADDTPGRARLGWQFDDGTPVARVLPTVPPMYVQDGLLGELTLAPASAALSAPAVQNLLAMVARAPLVAAGDSALLATRLAALGLDRLMSAPPALPRVVRGGVAPRPWLRLQSRPSGRADGGAQWQDYAVLGFEYEGMHVPDDGAAEAVRKHGRSTEVIERDPRRERAAREQLAALRLQPVAAGALDDARGAWRMAHDEDWIVFMRDDAPSLAGQGWMVEASDGFRFDLSAIDDWYAEVEEGGAAASAWFELELGIVVNGARIALLPLLLQLIRAAPREFDPAVIEARPDGEHLLARLPDGANVALPWGRVKPILRTLGELYFNDRVGERMRLPVLDAARLAELEESVHLRWLGGERLRALGLKLRSFGGVRPVAPPRGLQATLRPYQSAGLAWMQFLREFELGGILADDMGLGKTLQTLAHILLEKEAGRLDAPALVVAPTSLMPNWQAEAARFAPGLRVLLLHGAARAERYAEIGQHDLVLTTYALLPRDEAPLCAQRFHLLILDESQYIKNSRSKAAQTAALIPARHRLCLTGTPLQNHLGELWAQLHFLMPGLLGDEKRFNAEFRKPIEVLGDAARNAFLVRRIKPFLLRRTKDAVATDLPPKTEMVREVQLCGSQRDLYETVRLAMDKKVREAIASKGVARSQLVILEALLKLRQVCCDPRLVKRAGAKAAATPSAKLAALMEMIEALRDEGRKILVFSQFTSMLALIEAELRERAIGYALLTGDTLDRAAPVAAFQSGAVPLFLISLKAGGVGLNLTAADTVIHYDPWWNPAAEDQATDRAWRIGQDKPVFVYKLIAQGTLEQKIQELQRKKAALAGAVLDGGSAREMALTQDDLQAIFAPLP